MFVLPDLKGHERALHGRFALVPFGLCKRVLPAPARGAAEWRRARAESARAWRASGAVGLLSDWVLGGGGGDDDGGGGGECKAGRRGAWASRGEQAWGDGASRRPPYCCPYPCPYCTLPPPPYCCPYPCPYCTLPLAPLHGASRGPARQQQCTPNGPPEKILGIANPRHSDRGRLRVGPSECGSSISARSPSLTPRGPRGAGWEGTVAALVWHAMLSGTAFPFRPQNRFVRKPTRLQLKTDRARGALPEGFFLFKAALSLPPEEAAAALACVPSIIPWIVHTVCSLWPLRLGSCFARSKASLLRLWFPLHFRI